MLSGEYPYHSKVIGSDSGIEQDGGLVILSKWPILIQTEVLYKKNCSGADCYSDKGVLYTKILKGEKVYNFFWMGVQPVDASFFYIHVNFYNHYYLIITLTILS